MSLRVCCWLVGRSAGVGTGGAGTRHLDEGVAARLRGADHSLL